MWIHGWFVVVFGNTSWETLGLQSPTVSSAVLEGFCWCSELPFYTTRLLWASCQLVALTVCLQLVCHLVDFTLKSRISGKFVHHADRSLLLLHLLDFSPHLALLFGIFLHHLRELESNTAGQTRYKQRRWHSCRGADKSKWFDVAEFQGVKRMNIKLAVYSEIYRNSPWLFRKANHTQTMSYQTRENPTLSVWRKAVASCFSWRAT